MVTVVVMLSVLGLPSLPHSSINLSQRLAYNTMCGVFGASICYCTGVVVLFMRRFRGMLATGLAWTASMLIAAVPCTAIAHVAQDLLFGYRADLVGHYLEVATVLVAWTIPFYGVLCQYARFRDQPVTATPPNPALQEAVSPGRTGREGARTPGMAAPGADDRQAAARYPKLDAARAEPQNRFLRRLSPSLSGALIYVKTNGHYIDVHTTQATSSVLMRFADAIDELGGIGMRVHRSYWVAHDQVTGWPTRNQRAMVRITGHGDVPVSRTYLTAVRAAYQRLSVESDGQASAADELPRSSPGRELPVPVSNRP